MRQSFSLLSDFLRTLWIRHSRLRWAEKARRSEILTFQERRLELLLEYVMEHSPFYRKRWGRKRPNAADLDSLEPVGKSELVENFDDVLTDRSLDYHILESYLSANRRKPYVVVSTSGTTGVPILVPYLRAEWLEGLAHMVRGHSRRCRGIGEELRASFRMAHVQIQNPALGSTNITRSFDIFPGTRLHLSAGSPAEEQIEQLQRFQPYFLSGFPLAIDLLARAQLDGDLKIHPRIIMTGGDSLPAGLRQNVRLAWDTELFDTYGLTETLCIAHECHAHQGLHIDEDAVIIEVVDKDGHALPSGERGAAILATNLYNKTFPFIRYRVSDMMTLSDDPCPCGLNFARITSIEGRHTEMLRLRGISGKPVTVHPWVIERSFESLPGVGQFKIHTKGETATVRIVPRNPPPNLKAMIESALTEVCIPAGVAPEAIRVEIINQMDEQ